MRKKLRKRVVQLGIMKSQQQAEGRRLSSSLLLDQEYIAEEKNIGHMILEQPKTRVIARGRT